MTKLRKGFWLAMASIVSLLVVIMVIMVSDVALERKRQRDKEYRKSHVAEIKAQREANKDRQREYMKEWRKENRERLLTYTREYRSGNEAYKAKKRDGDRRYYDRVVKNSPEHIARRKEFSKAYDLAHPEAHRARHDRYVSSHRDLLSDRARAKYRATPEDERKRSRIARKAYYQQWRASHKEELRAYDADRYERTKEQQAEYHKAYYAANRLAFIHRANNRLRKLRERGTFTQADIDYLYVSQAGKCTGCRKSLDNKFEIDHVMPVSRGGMNTADNLQLLCRSCNRKKRDMHPDDWAARIGKLFV